MGGDYIPTTIEQMVVCFADKMVSSDLVRPLEEEVKRFETKGHDVKRLLALKNNLEKEVGEDLETLVLGRLHGTLVSRTLARKTEALRRPVSPLVAFKWGLMSISTLLSYGNSASSGYERV